MRKAYVDEKIDELEKEQGKTVASAMISALNALTQVPSSADAGLVARLADDDPSLKVRQAAIEARKALENDAG